MSKNQFFNFENENLDFPFYKSGDLSSVQWIVLTLSFIITGLLIMIPTSFEFVGLLYFIIPFLGILYASKGKLDVICKKLSFSDVKLMIIILILSAVYSIVVAALLVLVFNIQINANPVFNETPSLFFWFSFVLQLFGEELIIIIPFLISLALFYKFTENRKLSIIISVLISVGLFGLFHYNAYHSIVSILLIQGIGSIIRLYGYLKTKNILVTFLIHVFYDLMFIVPGLHMLIFLF